MRPLALLSLLLGLVPTVGLAEDAPRQRSARLGGLWADVLVPEDTRRFYREGVAHLIDGLGPQQADLLDDPPFAELEIALRRFARARPHYPNDPDLAFYTAIALTRYERPAREGGVERRVDEAVDAWQRLRDIAPSYMPARVAVELAALYARRGELERSVAEYEAALGLVVPDAAWLMMRTYQSTPWERRLAMLFASPPVELIHGNLAECRMHLGQLDRAVTHYRASILISTDPQTRTLGLWGLALAQQRLGDRDAFLRTARRAIATDPLAADMRFDRLRDRYGSMAVLHHPTVFFEPAFEIHAYHAIGYEAYAGMATHDGSRWRVLGLALQSWRRYLAMGGTSSRFAGNARAAVERLEREIEALPEDPPNRTSPWGISDRHRWRARDEPWLPLNLP